MAELGCGTEPHTEWQWLLDAGYMVTLEDEVVALHSWKDDWLKDLVSISLVRHHSVENALRTFSIIPDGRPNDSILRTRLAHGCSRVRIVVLWVDGRRRKQRANLDSSLHKSLDVIVIGTTGIGLDTISSEPRRQWYSDIRTLASKVYFR